MRRPIFIEYAATIVLVVALAITFSFPATYAQQAQASQTLRGHVPPAIARLHLRPLYNLSATNELRLAISLPLRNEQALNDLLHQTYDPASPSYHHYLTSDQFNAQFGPSQQDYDAVVQFFRSNGLAVVQTHSDRTLVDVTGSVATIQNVFHTTLRVYQHPVENRTFFAPDTDPVIDLNVPLKHIDGLDNFIIPRPLIRPESPSSRPGAKPALGSGPGGEYMGKDFRAAYAPGVALNGAGQAVALFELDGYFTNDIAFYEQTNGLPQQTLVNVAVDGGVSSPGDGVDEVSLDVEMVVSMATNLSEVLVYEAPNGGNTSVPDLLSRIASDNIAKQISSSWLIGDSSSYDTYYEKMAMQGQSFFQASGDDGAYYSGIQEWADDTNITLVGGTTLSTTGPAGAWSSETVWNWYNIGEGPGGSGGGVNFNNVPIPYWQTNVSMANNMGNSTLRNVPDVALTGDNIYVVYENGQTEDVGGTSCAAPLWAAFTAMVNQQALAEGETTVGFLNPAIYALGLSANYTNCFHDIATGNNTNTEVGPTEYFATNGYDLCTGWGTPNGANLINALTAPPTTLAITPATGFTATGLAGGPFTPNSQTYGVTNTGGSSFKWSLSNTSSWLVASITNGTLAAGKGTNVTISLTANANTLAPGTYTATVTFTNVSSNTVQSLQFSLDAIEPLVVVPVSGFSASGAVGGPFTPTSQTFSLTNLSQASLSWQAGGPVWLNLSPSSGTLAAGASATVSASLTAAVNDFIAGTYSGQIAFTDEISGVVQDRPVTLSIGQNIVLNGGFETGDFTDWNLATNGIFDGTIVDDGSTTGIPAHSGTYFAALGQSGSVGYISQTLSTVANRSYLLSLWLYPPTLYNSRGHEVANTPNQFIVSWNGTTQFNETDVPSLSLWTNLQFIVTATGPQTVLQIGGRDDPSWLGLDDVNVWPIPVPNIRSFSRVPGNRFSITWYSFTNIEYQVQSTTNLVSPHWVNLNTYTATGPVISVTNSITNTADFYRVLQLP